MYMIKCVHLGASMIILPERRTEQVLEKLALAPKQRSNGVSRRNVRKLSPPRARITSYSGADWLDIAAHFYRTNMGGSHKCWHRLLYFSLTHTHTQM